MRKILHISAHLGGGVGRVLLNYLGQAQAHEEERHAVWCLDQVNPDTVQAAADLGIPLQIRAAQRIPDLLQAVAAADLVLIHWWNHPLLHAFLMRETLPPSRLLLWSHVSGHTPTQCITDSLTAYPDLFVVAAPYSMEVPALVRLSDRERRDRIRLVFSCGGIDHVAAVHPVPHDGFRVGYVGSVDYWKLHLDFIRMSAAAQIPGVRFVVCGGPQEAELRRDAEQAGVGHLFEFLGHVNDVTQHLSGFDLFGYPINPGQSGTGEQALIEALAAGVPPVVLRNGAERYIVEDGVTGIIADDEAGYARALEKLYHDPQLRLQMAENARKSARSRFTLESTVKAWQAVYQEAARLPKRPHSWPTRFSGRATPAEIFVESLGEYGHDFAEMLQSGSLTAGTDAARSIAALPEIFRSDTRGSVFHYLSWFPEDPALNFWGRLIRPDRAA